MPAGNDFGSSARSGRKNRNKPKRPQPKNVVVQYNLSCLTGKETIDPQVAFTHIYTGLPGKAVYGEVYVESLDPSNPKPNLIIKTVDDNKKTEWEPVPLQEGANSVITNPLPLASGQRIAVFIDQPCKVWYSFYTTIEAPSSPKDIPIPKEEDAK